MSKRDLIYWTKGFNFSRNHHGDRVVVEAYRLLSHYTEENPNCRVGKFIEKIGENPRFFSIREMTEDTFEILVQRVLYPPPQEDPDDPWQRPVSGFKKTIDDFLSLKSGVLFQYESKSSFKDIFGYKFRESISLILNPNDIIQVEGNSLDDFYIKFSNCYLEVCFRDQISITTMLPVKYDPVEYEKLRNSLGTLQRSK